MYGKALMYLIGSGAIGYVILSIATPSEDELKKIRAIGGTNKAFSDVIKAAADPASKPLYLKKPGADHNPFQTDVSPKPK